MYLHDVRCCDSKSPIISAARGTYPMLFSLSVSLCDVHFQLKPRIFHSLSLPGFSQYSTAHLMYDLAARVIRGSLVLKITRLSKERAYSIPVGVAFAPL